MEELEALLIQNKNNFDETISILEAILLQTKNNNSEQILDAVIQQNERLLEAMKELKSSIVSIPETNLEQTQTILGSILEELKTDKEINISLDLI